MRRSRKCRRLQAVPAIIASFVLAIPIARLARVARPLRAVLVTGSSLLYAVPSLALFVILPFIRLIAFVLAFALFAAFMAVPTAILFGYVDAPMATGDYYPQFCDAIGSSAEHFAECATATH